MGGGIRPPPPSWECSKKPRLDRVKHKWHPTIAPTKSGNICPSFYPTSLRLFPRRLPKVENALFKFEAKTEMTTVTADTAAIRVKPWFCLSKTFALLYLRFLFRLSQSSSSFCLLMLRSMCSFRASVAVLRVSFNSLIFFSRLAIFSLLVSTTSSAGFPRKSLTVFIPFPSYLIYYHFVNVSKWIT